MLEQPVAEGEMQPVVNPAEPKDIVGYVREASDAEVQQALTSAINNAPIWFATPPQERAAILERAAVLMESQMPTLMGILVREAGKTFSNAIAEVREAVDFLHYYAGRCATISIMKLTARWVRWSVSARGTSRWRSSPARLPPRWRPATACWRNLPSRRRLSPPRAWRFCWKPACRRALFNCCRAAGDRGRRANLR